MSCASAVASPGRRSRQACRTAGSRWRSSSGSWWAANVPTGAALKLVADRRRGVLIGATLVTPRAGEIVGELVLAIKLGIPLSALADVVHPFPAFSRVLGESLSQLAAEARS